MSFDLMVLLLTCKFDFYRETFILICSLLLLEKKKKKSSPYLNLELLFFHLLWLEWNDIIHNNGKNDLFDFLHNYDQEKNLGHI